MAQAYTASRVEFYIFLGSFSDEDRQTIEGHLEKIDAQRYWPDVPYDYSQGIIFAYERWRDSLSVKDRDTEIAACQKRYADKYQRRLDLARDYVSKNHLQPVRPVHIASPKAARPTKGD